MRQRVDDLLGVHALINLGRAAVAGLAALLALAALFVAAPRATRAEGLPEQAVLKVDPSCGPSFLVSEFGQNIQLGVRGYGFQPGVTLVFTFDNQPAKVIGDSIVVAANGTFTGTIEAYQAARDGTFWVVASDVNNRQFGVWAQFVAPCPPVQPTITVTPNCFNAGVGTTVHVSGAGWRDGFEIRTGIVDTVDTSIVYTVSDPIASSGGSWDYDLSFTAPGSGVYRVTAVQTGRSVGARSNGGLALAASAVGYYINQYIEVPCPILTVVPFCDGAGNPPDRYSFTLRGSQFVPGESLEIVFDPDGTPATYQWDYTVADDGSWGDEVIEPYKRPPGTYDVMVRQFRYDTASRTDVLLHETRVAVQVPCPEGEVTLSQDCSPPQLLGDIPRAWQFTATGSGFQPGYGVHFTFDADLAAPAFFQETRDKVAGDDGTATVPFEVRARPAGTYRLLAQQQIGDVTIEGSATFRSPCRTPRPSVTIDPDCGPAAAGQPGAYSIAVTANGFVAGYAEIIFDETGTKEVFKTLATGSGTITKTINPSGRSLGGYSVTVRQQDANRVLAEASATFTVTCQVAKSPVLTIDPTVAQPGLVVRVQGTDFTENSTVLLRWNTGIGSSVPIQVTTDGSGGFDQQVLIFRHDFLGLRTMTAEAPGNASAYPGVSAQLMVAAGRGSPPVFNVFGVPPGEPKQIVDRR